MGILKNIFKVKENPIKTYDDFWKWFRDNERYFHKVIKENYNLEKKFFDKLSPKLNELKKGFWYVVGMNDSDTAELVITADGIVENIVFIEELVAAAPKLNNWKFTALKPAIDINIEMEGYKFTNENLYFSVNEHKNYPDEIDISIIHDNCIEENKQTMANGIHLFLSNYLGELDYTNVIDNIRIETRKETEQGLIQIGKLRDYLKWRQKEFIERYDGTKHNTENEEHSVLTAQHEDGSPLVATINTDLLKWNSKASHPWVLKIDIPYAGVRNGIPDETMRLLLNEIENDICSQLNDYEGYLYIGRQTGKNVREVYFACIDFRKPSKVVYQVQKKYEKSFIICYNIYKDKYWQSFSRFIQNI